MNLRLLAVLILLFPVLLTARSEKSNRDGLEIVVEEKKDKKEVPHYWPFQVQAKNTSVGGRTLHGEIELWSKSGEKNKCILYLEVPAGSTKTELVQCPGERSLKSWKFRVESIWYFIPG